MMQIGQYARFECARHRKSITGYPYQETELLAVVTNPAGRQISFWGFYDGEDTWRFRYMPDQPGLWKVQLSFADGSDAWDEAFECVPSNLPGMICAYPDNPVWFGFSGGTPFHARSLHAGDRLFAGNWPDEKRKAYLDWIQQQGYNMLSIASFFVNRQTFERGMGWDTPQLWPLNAKEYQRAETILDELERRGIVIFPFAGFFGREGFNPTAHRDQERYVRYVLARWGCYWNLLFNVGGPEPILDVNPFMPRCEVEKLGYMIRGLDPYHHLLTVHNQTGNDQFGLTGFQTYATLQGPKTISLDELHSGLLRNHPAQGPLYAQETLWTDNIYGHPQYTNDELRRNAYVIAMSGAVLNYGDMAGDSSSGFSGHLELEERVQVRHDIVKRVWDNLYRFEWYRLKPDARWHNGVYALSSGGDAYLMYAVGEQTIQLDLPDCHDAYQLVRVDTLGNAPDTVQSLCAGAVSISVKAGEEVLLSITPQT